MIRPRDPREMVTIQEIAILNMFEIKEEGNILLTY